MAVLLDIPMPDGCRNCPLNDDDWACVVTGKPIAEYGSPADCPIYGMQKYGETVMDNGTKNLTIK